MTRIVEKQTLSQHKLGHRRFFGLAIIYELRPIIVQAMSVSPASLDWLYRHHWCFGPTLMPIYARAEVLNPIEGGE